LGQSPIISFYLINAEQIQALIDWTEQLWQSNPELQEMVNPDDYERVLESLKQSLNGQ
jgi:hypothetical protein